MRADAARRAHQDQERDRPDADVPPLVPRGHLRLMLYEHRGRQHPGLHQVGGVAGRGARVHYAGGAPREAVGEALGRCVVCGRCEHGIGEGCLLR